jgi:hypothetical protein
MRYRGKWVTKDGLKYVDGEDKEVEILEDICTASIKGRYVIWGSLEKFVGVDETNGKDIWVKFDK